MSKFQTFSRHGKENDKIQGFPGFPGSVGTLHSLSISPLRKWLCVKKLLITYHFDKIRANYAPQKITQLPSLLVHWNDTVNWVHLILWNLTTRWGKTWTLPGLTLVLTHVNIKDHTNSATWPKLSANQRKLNFFKMWYFDLIFCSQAWCQDSRGFCLNPQWQMIRDNQVYKNILKIMILIEWAEPWNKCSLIKLYYLSCIYPVWNFQFTIDCVNKDSRAHIMHCILLYNIPSVLM